VSDGKVVWQDQPDVGATDISTVLDEIARAIAGQLQVTLGDVGKARGTKDAAAYQLFLKGVYLFRRRHIPEAVAQLERATARDSSFARGWAALSQALMITPQYTATHVSDVLPAARDAAQRAVRIDSSLSDAHGALGFVHAEAFEWEQAEVELSRAITLDTNAAEPRYRFGYTLLSQGKVIEAIPQLRGAVVRDQGYFIAWGYLGFAEFLNGQTEGLDDERQALKLEPTNSAVLRILSCSFARAGLIDSARVYARRLTKDTRPGPLGGAAYALARSGATDEAMKLTLRVEALPDDAWNKWSGLTIAYAGLGDSAKARMIDAMKRVAATEDGNGFPSTAAVYLVGELPADPQVDSVLHRFNWNPRLFVKRSRGP
jgi:tetratricopeptide (TPR) repeat protein